jgi:UDP-N-acetylmuramoyl-tripeptide--D-alanyl-D-alanine ligase
MKTLLKSLVVKILVFEARILLKRHKPTIIAITGSVGKTTTKDAIYVAIKDQFKSVRKSEKSYNSEIGVPLTVLGLSNAWSNPFLWFRNIIDGFFTSLFSRQYPDVLVLETGIDRPGDMESLVSWLTPDVVILTRLPEVPVHVEYFKTPEAVVAEKMKLVTAMKPNGVLIYNRDDMVIEAQLPTVLQRRVGFGRFLEADYQASNDRVVYYDDRPSGVGFLVRYQGVSQEIVVNGTVGTHCVYSCTAAVAVAVELGLSFETTIKALSTLDVTSGRMRLISGLKGSQLIDDTYNSSPVACEHALETLRELKYASRKIVVLGDMLELGRFSVDEHRRIGALVSEVADVLLTVGVRARGIAEGALSAGMHESVIFQYDDVARAGRELQALLKLGDFVLIKASQGIRAERIVEEVMAEPERASELLARQSREWQNIA